MLLCVCKTEITIVSYWFIYFFKNDTNGDKQVIWRWQPCWTLLSNIPVSLHRDIRASHNQTNTQTKAEEKENKYKPTIFILIKLNNSLGKEDQIFFIYIFICMDVSLTYDSFRAAQMSLLSMPQIIQGKQIIANTNLLLLLLVQLLN